MASSFIACMHCGCHAKTIETTCPHCGGELRQKDGAIPRTAVAMLLGLSAIAVPALGTASCGGDVSSGSTSGGGHGGSTVQSSAVAYGVASSGPGTGGFAPAYGVAQTGSGGTGGAPAAAYGIAVTVSSSGSGGQDGGH